MKPFDIPAPCHEDWNQMRRDGGARHCASCDKHVVDLATLTARQVRGLVALTGGDFCGRQTIRDGALVLLPEPSRPRSPFALRMVVGGAIAASAFGLAACEPAQAAAPDPIHVTQVDPDPAPAPEPTPRPPTLGELPRPDIQMAGGISAPPTIANDTVSFAPQSAKLDKDALALIADIASTINASPWMSSVHIAGHFTHAEHTRPTKDAALALARAEAVRDALVKQGVARERLHVAMKGVGAARSVTFSL